MFIREGSIGDGGLGESERKEERLWNKRISCFFSTTIHSKGEEEKWQWVIYGSISPIGRFLKVFLFPSQIIREFKFWNLKWKENLQK